MRILLLGNNGQLGWELHRTLALLGEVIAQDYPQIDLTRPESLRKVVQDVHPQVIVNATAYTAVDRAENESETAMAVNAVAPGVLAQEATALGAALIHYSTDYVFDGAKGSPYLESDIPNPLGVYGRSKLAGEQAVQQVGGTFLILRTSWVYSLRRDSFVTKVRQWARQQPELKVVSDQVGNPTWARMLAEVSAHLLAKAGEDVTGWLSERSGLYHLAGSGHATRLEWAQSILDDDPRPQEIVTHLLVPALTADFPTPAQRPLYSALDCEKFTRVFSLSLPAWQVALRLALEASS